MKRTLLCGLGVATSTMTVMAVTAVPASAADTTTTFALAGGNLTVSAPATAALTNGNSGATSVSGSLGNTVVTDNRGGTQGWVASAATTVFSNGTTNDTGVSYNSGLPTSTGIVVATSTLATALTAVPAPVLRGTVVIGNNTATWNPTLTVSLPVSSTAGNYSGTITTSVL